MLVHSLEVLDGVPDVGLAEELGVLNGRGRQLSGVVDTRVEVVAILERRVEVGKRRADVDFNAICVFSGARRVQRVGVGGALPHAAVSTVVATVTEAAGLQCAVPSTIVGGHERGVVIVEVLKLPGAVHLVHSLADSATRGVSLGVDLHREGAGVVLSKICVILAHTVAIALVGASGTLASRAFMSLVASAHTGGAVAHTSVGALDRSLVECGAGNSCEGNAARARHERAVGAGELGLEIILGARVASGVEDLAFEVAVALIVGVALTAARAGVGARGEGCAQRAGKDKSSEFHFDDGSKNSCKSRFKKKLST